MADGCSSCANSRLMVEGYDHAGELVCCALPPVANVPRPFPLVKPDMWCASFAKQKPAPPLRTKKPPAKRRKK